MIATGNPYIGPRPFREEDAHLFFGRSREARELNGLLATEKLVLLYAQSGAGKTSLLHARLIPELKSKEFEVLPVGRVSGDAPPGLHVENIYIFNLMQSLLDERTDSETLARISLADFLKRLNYKEAGYFYDQSAQADAFDDDGNLPIRRIMIIDQFEELFSTHVEAWQRREDFFSQLAQAMEDDRFLWVLLVLREDFLASLDPFAHYLPGITRARYYMQQLDRRAALQAVKRPVEQLRPFADGVAEKFVEEVLSIRVMNAAGTLDVQAGQYVEPIQLQVICYDLWQSLSPEGTEITERDLKDRGDVNRSIGNYYASQVRNVAVHYLTKERLIRYWFQNVLMSPNGIRQMVPELPDGSSTYLSNDVLRALTQTYLVRVELRRGTRFYELSHDRLVEPIVEDNRIWFEANLSPLQRQASLWDNEGRSDNWLLIGQALDDGQQWAAEHPDEITTIEQEYLSASRRRQAQLQEEGEQFAYGQSRAIKGSRSVKRLLAAVIVLYVATVLWMFMSVNSINDRLVTILLLPVAFLAGFFFGRNSSR